MNKFSSTSVPVSFEVFQQELRFNLDLSEVMLQLDSAWGKADSRGNSEELIDIFFYLIRATLILILSPLIASYYFCEEMLQLVSAWGKADSRGNFEDLVDTFYYLIRTTLLLILIPSIIACYFCEEMMSLILYFIRSS